MRMGRWFESNHSGHARPGADIPPGNETFTFGSDDLPFWENGDRKADPPVGKLWLHSGGYCTGLLVAL